jgi:antitoxin (DNA-binding transcriptional repressor) of toxin-antitoxin stability system
MSCGFALGRAAIALTVDDTPVAEIVPHVGPVIHDQ